MHFSRATPSLQANPDSVSSQCPQPIFLRIHCHGTCTWYVSWYTRDPKGAIIRCIGTTRVAAHSPLGSEMMVPPGPVGGN